jgi:hypothetical protein
MRLCPFCHVRRVCAESGGEIDPLSLSLRAHTQNTWQK